MSEWKEVLSVVITGLKNCGYKESGVEGMQRLLEYYRKLPVALFQYSHVHQMK